MSDEEREKLLLELRDARQKLINMEITIQAMNALIKIIERDLDENKIKVTH
ncbi:MAG: hypothetical protein AB7O96_00860 [Pseudobdellovibrionaceae bacterium]